VRCARQLVRRWGAALWVAALWAGAPAAHAAGAQAEPAPKQVLKVCQDPNNLPFSRSDLSGFENKIAALFAQELGWDIAYTWFPQRMGFVRNTLRAKEPNSDAFKCDLITGVSTGFDMGATTQPYYRSTYAMAYLKGKGLDGVRTLEDLLALEPGLRQRLRLGVFAGSPITDWLLQNGLIGQMVSYQSQTGDAEQYPGEMVEKDLASGKIDIAFAWGPIAGYFAKQSAGGQIVAVPLAPRPGVQFDFAIAMAVRHGDKQLKQRIDQLIAKNQTRISAILEQYGVPLLDERGQLMTPSRSH
jgi:mxaJ protein